MSESVRVISIQRREKKYRPVEQNHVPSLSPLLCFGPRATSTQKHLAKFLTAVRAPSAICSAVWK